MLTLRTITEDGLLVSETDLSHKSYIEAVDSDFAEAESNLAEGEVLQLVLDDAVIAEVLGSDRS